MASEKLAVAMRQLREATANHGAVETPDHDLLARFLDQQSQSDFEILVRRHGPMVLCVGQRLMRNQQDAEDIFQATFLTLARKASSLRKPGSLASWLHGVAHRLGLQLRAARRREAIRESRLTERAVTGPVAEITLREAQTVLDGELCRLSEKYRAPLVLCYLEGKTRDEAARELRMSLATLKRRLDRGRELLRVRLSRLGLSVPAALSATFLAESAATATAPGLLLHTTAQAALQLITGKPTAAGLVSAGAHSLAEGMARTMWMKQLKSAALCFALVVLATGAGLYAHHMSANDLSGNTAGPVAQDGLRNPPGTGGQAPPVQAQTQIPLGKAKAVEANNEDTAKDGYVIFQVKTELQRNFVPKQNLYVFLDTTAALADGKISLREMNLPKLEKALLAHKKADTKLHLNLFIRTNDAVGSEHSSILRLAMIGNFHWKGFPEVTAAQTHSNENVTWQERTATFTGKQRQPQGDETAAGDKLVKAYPVRTQFSRYLTGDSDCVVIVPSLENENGVVPQRIREAISDAVAKLNLPHKKRIMFSMPNFDSESVQQLINEFHKFAEKLGFETSTVKLG